MITVSNLNKYYGTKRVLSNINLEFSQNGIYGLLGNNGAGKSTLLRCLAGLEPYKGNVLYGPCILKNIAGYLPTAPYVPSKITGGEYIELFCEARKIHITALDENNLFGLPLRKYASTYSSGMIKKMALTAILLQKNEVYLLDEPLAGLDFNSVHMVKRIILGLQKKGKTVIIASHNISFLSELCNRVDYLEKGVIKSSFPQSDFALMPKMVSTREENFDFQKYI